jgi:hypothetical protein
MDLFWPRSHSTSPVPTEKAGDRISGLSHLNQRKLLHHWQCQPMGEEGLVWLELLGFSSLEIHLVAFSCSWEPWAPKKSSTKSIGTGCIMAAFVHSLSSPLPLVEDSSSD